MTTGGDPDGADAGPGKTITGGQKADLVRLLGVLNLPDPWTDFFIWQAYGESRWHTSAHNGNPATKMGRNEIAASVKAYKRNAIALGACGWPESAYTKGSGGWGGLLYPNAAMMFKEHANRCVEPSAIVHDAKRSLAAMVGFANGLQHWTGWKKEPTLINTRVGWGWPGKMGDAAYIAKRRPGYTKSMKRIGLDPGALLDRQMPKLRMTADEALAILEGSEAV